ncbi:MarR family transcriptional regulator [Sulfolobus tengchongensis]|uniref:HTH-type transcriptional regulator SarZ n=1 Tax=Sulfolobus tengchongensis TaxID=207809 RepID=A0AAX4L154_9CREN
MQRVDEKLQVIGLIARIFRGLQRELNKRLGELGLSYLDFSILRATSEEPRSMVYLANRYFVTQSAITVAVDRLESNGLVRRIRDSKDRRVVVVEITEKGREILKEGNEIYKKLVAEILSDVHDNEVNELIDKLTKILSKIESSID